MLAAGYRGGRSSPSDTGIVWQDTAAAPPTTSTFTTFTEELPPYPGLGHFTLARGPPPPPDSWTTSVAPPPSQSFHSLPALGMSKCQYARGVVILLVFVLVFIGVGIFFWFWIHLFVPRTGTHEMFKLYKITRGSWNITRSKASLFYIIINITILH